MYAEQPTSCVLRTHEEVRPWFLQEVGCSDCRRVVYMTLNDTEISKNDSARGSTTNQGPSSFFNKASQTCMQQGECVKEHLEGCWELTAGPFLQPMRRFGNYYVRLLFPNLLPLFSRTHHHFRQLFLKHFSQDSLVDFLQLLWASETVFGSQGQSSVQSAMKQKDSFASIAMIR